MSKRGLSFKLAIFIPLFLILTSTIVLASSEKASLMDVLSGKVSFIDWMTGKQVQGTKLETFFCDPQLNECAQSLYCAASPRGGPQRCCPIGKNWCSSNSQCIPISSFNDVTCPIVSQGDLDNDGDADCVDLTMLVESVQHSESYTTAQQIAIRDINGDGQLDVYDVLALRDRVLNRGLVCGTSIPPQTPLVGDINSDGAVNCNDLGLLPSLIQSASLTSDQRARGDIDSDGDIDMLDFNSLRTRLGSCPTGAIGELPDLVIDDNIVWSLALRELRFQLKNIGRQANIPAARLSITLSKGSQVINASLTDKTLGTQNGLTVPYSISAITLQRLIGEGQLNLEVRIDLTNRVRESNENNNIFRKTIALCPAGQTLNAQLYCISPSTSNQYTLTPGRVIQVPGGILVKLVQSSPNSAMLDITLLGRVGRPLERERIEVNVNALRVSKGLAIANLLSNSTSATLQITPVTPGTSTTTPAQRVAESSGAPIEFSLRQTQTIVGNEIQLVSSSTTQVLLTLVPRTGALQYIRILAGETKPVGSLRIKNARSDATSATLEIMPP